jgi:hypothetical protein
MKDEYLHPVSLRVFAVAILVAGTLTMKCQSVTADFTFTVGTNGNVDFTSTSVNVPTNTVHRWVFGDGSSVTNVQSPSHSYTVNGYYAVLLSLETSMGVIRDSVYKSFIVNSVITGLPDQPCAVSEELIAYPNPAVEKVHIDINLNAPGKPQTLIVQDVNGRHLAAMSVNDQRSQEIDISGFEAGIYYLTLLSGDHLIIGRGSFIRR